MFSWIVEYAYRTQTIDEVLEDGAEMVIIKEYVEKIDILEAAIRYGVL
jgi:hypothetical protein